MARLWYFNPDNDIALARDVVAFTPPAAARAVAEAGDMLPSWMASEGDAVASHSGVNLQWLEEVKTAFGLDASPWDHDPTGLVPEPWGWSRAVRTYFAKNGFAPSQLPSDGYLDLVRDLSHRRTAAEVHRRLAAALDFEVWPAAVEVSDPDELRRMVDERPCVVKTPWSSSGRGVAFTEPGADIRNLAGSIARQDSVMVERAATRVCDFAVLFEMRGGECRQRGLSLFATAPSGEYVGNVVDTPENVRTAIEAAVGEQRLKAVEDTLPRVLQEVAAGYEGPLGVDMLVDAGGMIHPVVEINFRYTMGFVALALASRVGRRALLRMADSRQPVRAAEVQGGRLVRGALRLTPPGAQMIFVLDCV